MDHQPNYVDSGLDPDPSGNGGVNNNDVPGCSRSRSGTSARIASATSLGVGVTASRNNNSNANAISNTNSDGNTITISLPEKQQQTQEQGRSVDKANAPWLPPEAGTGNKRVVWKPKHQRPDRDRGRGREELDDQFKVEQCYTKDKESGAQNAAVLLSVAVVSGTGTEDDPDFRKEPLDKPGKSTRQEEAGRDGPSPIRHIFVQFVNCSRHTFEVSRNLQIRELRTKFLAKVMLVKTVQWTFLLACIVTMRMFPEIEALFIKTPEIGYIFMMTYITAVAAARACEYGRKIWGALLTLDIETICLVYMVGQLLFSTEDYVLPATAITIAMTNLSLTILFFLSKVDVSENSPLYGTSSSLVLVLSVAAMFAATTLYPPPKTQSWLKKLCTISFFNFIVAETYVVMEVSDIHFILRGYRFPVSEDDWLPVAASLF